MFQHPFPYNTESATAPASPVITMISLDYLIERHNDAAEAMYAALRAVFQHAKDTGTYVTVFNDTRHLPFSELLTEVGAYHCKFGNYRLLYTEISELDHDPETGTLEVTIH